MLALSEQEKDNARDWMVYYADSVIKPRRYISEDEAVKAAKQAVEEGNVLSARVYECVATVQRARGSDVKSLRPTSYLGQPLATDHTGAAIPTDLRGWAL